MFVTVAMRSQIYKSTACPCGDYFMKHPSSDKWWCFFVTFAFLVITSPRTHAACTYETTSSSLRTEVPPTIVGSSITCPGKYSCHAGIIRGCRSVLCSGVASCSSTQILELPDSGRVVCAGDVEQISCKSVVIETINAEASNVTVECKGSCFAADITGAQRVLCDGSSCGFANIRNVLDGGAVSCSGSSSCFEATVRPMEQASISIHCTGSESCSRATLDGGKDGTVDCVGGCLLSVIERASTVSCPTRVSCGGSHMKAISDGGSVTCSGESGCLDAAIEAADGVSLRVECSGEESCAEARIVAGSNGYVLCSGPKSCEGDIDDTFGPNSNTYATSVGSKCLVCEPGSCTNPCHFFSEQCIDGQENGDCSSLDMTFSPVDEGDALTPSTALTIFQVSNLFSLGLLFLIF